MEVIIPTKIGIPTLRTNVPEQLSTKSIVKDLDMEDELCEIAAIRIVSYHRILANLYNRRVKPRVFQPGNLVIRKVFENIVDPTTVKFKLNWEGPYIVTRVGESGSYALNKLDRTPVL